MSNFLTFGNIARTAMMPVCGATGAVTGEYVGELLDLMIYPFTHEIYILRICAVLGCAVVAGIGAVLKLYWEGYEHKKNHDDSSEVID